MAGAISGGGMNLDGGDPRMGSAAGLGHGEAEAVSRSACTRLHDPSITIEEYMRYAAITRADGRRIESAPSDDVLKVAGLRLLNPFAKGREPAVATTIELAEKATAEAPSDGRFVITEEEYIQASRAVRTATWGAVFFLITTDILGPFSTAWAFRQLGYGPGAVLYTIFAALAG